MQNTNFIRQSGLSSAALYKKPQKNNFREKPVNLQKRTSFTNDEKFLVEQEKLREKLAAQLVYKRFSLITYQKIKKEMLKKNNNNNKHDDDTKN